MQVKDIMTSNPVCCTTDMSLKDAAQMMIDNDCGAIPVIDGNNGKVVVGIITDRDIVVGAVANGETPIEMSVGNCMTAPVVTVTPETTVSSCCQTMEERQVRRIPVIDANGECCGIVAQADVARHTSAKETGEVVKQVSQPC